MLRPARLDRRMSRSENVVGDTTAEANAPVQVDGLAVNALFEVVAIMFAATVVDGSAVSTVFCHFITVLKK